MPTWKKVVISGSGLSQLANDANYLAQSGTGAILTGSFQGDGSGLTGVVSAESASIGAEIAALQTFSSSLDASFTTEAELNASSSTLQSNIDAKSSITQLNASSSTLQTSIDTKAPSANPTFTGTVSGVTATHVGLGSVDNTSDADKPVSTAQQTEIDTKADIASPTFTGTVSGVTSAMVGLGNVDNTSDANKPISTATQTEIDTKADIASPTFTGTVSGITSAMVGLGNVDNTSDANKPVSTAQQTEIDTKADIASPTFTGTVSGISSAMVGLGNVDNTSDANKPVSTAQQTEIDTKADLASPALTGNPTAPTQADNDNSTKIATTAYVQREVSDLLGGAPAAFDTLLEISASIADGDSDVVALTTVVGGKLQKDQNLSDLTDASTARTNIGLGNVDNTSDANKPVSTATQTALDAKAPLASPTFTGTVSGVTATHVGLGNVDNTSDANKPVSTAAQTALDLKANLASPTFTGTVSGITSTMVGLGNVDNTSDANKPISTATQTALDAKSSIAQLNASSSALGTAYTAADTTLSSSLAASIATNASNLAGLTSGELTSGSFGVVLDPVTGSIGFTEGLEIGDVYDQGAGTTDIRVPAGASWLELNYADTDFIYLDGTNAGIQVNTGGTVHEWQFQSTGDLSAPGNISLAANKAFNGIHNGQINANNGVLSGSVEGDSQGQIKLNDQNVNINALGTGDSPTFANLTISGDLTTLGTVTNINSSDLNVEDKFILLNSGSATGNSGLIVQNSSTQGLGTSLHWDDTAKRWGLDYAGANANTDVISSDAHLAAVVTSDDANYQKVGNIRIDGEDAYIYTS